MVSTTGLDIMRGRPTPSMGTTEAKLQQRKLDALRRGVHRIADPAAVAANLHMVGIGTGGAAMVAAILEAAKPDLLADPRARLTALAIEVGEDRTRLDAIDKAGTRFAGGQAHIETMLLPVPDPDALADTQSRYAGFLRLEYPLYRWGDTVRPWVARAEGPAATGESVSRALAKAIYGRAYYDGDRPAAAALGRFATHLEAVPGDAVVCLLFELGDPAGSGIAVDLARHLSNSVLGRRVLVTGIGIAPCGGSTPPARGADLYAVLNELDVLADETKNAGVVQSCGDLFKNPFTAGFLVVPTEPAWRATGDVAAASGRARDEVAALLLARNGANLWELLRLLNWVAAPSTQHSAARTPWGARWLHVLAYADIGTGAGSGAIPLDGIAASRLGVSADYRPEFLELRVEDAQAPQAVGLGERIGAMFAPEAAPVVVGGGIGATVQFVLPRVAKTDLALFAPARDAYDSCEAAARVAHHALLLEQGVVLSEPSTQLEGMAGAGLHGGPGWVAVPYDALRGTVPGTEGARDAA